MNKKLREQLECRKQWVYSSEKNYCAWDFKSDWQRFAHTIEESHYLELISDSVYEQCKHTLMDYMGVFCKG